MQGCKVQGCKVQGCKVRGARCGRCTENGDLAYNLFAIIQENGGIMNATIDIKGIVGRAMKDPAFRQRLIADPKATIEREFAVSLPPDISVQVHEASDKVWHILLPNPLSRELSDAELEALSGGAETVHLYLKASGTDIR